MKSRVLDIVVPMAGRGSRFSEAGYELPKPLVEFAGRPMISHVIDNLRPKVAHRFIFLALEDHIKKFDLPARLRQWTRLSAENCVCVPVKTVTEGAACTVLLARDALNLDQDVLIANSDQIVDVSVDQFISSARSLRVLGSIMVFKASGEKWSYAKTNADGNVIEVAEKKMISEWATVGLYYFNPVAEFLRAADQMIEKNIRTNGEFYICPIYNEMIEQGSPARIRTRRIITFPILAEAMHGIGTPEDLEAYLRTLSERQPLRS